MSTTKRVQHNKRRNPSASNPVLALSARRTGGPNDPPSVPSTIRMMHKVSFSLIPTGGFTYANLFKALPGQAPGSPYWKNMRLQKVSAWDTTGKGAVILSFPNDAIQFEDHGVMGAKASALHVTPPLMTRIAWVPITDLTTVAFNTTIAVGEQLVVHATVEVNSS